MIFKPSRTTKIAEGAAAYLLEGLRDCPHCHHAAELLEERRRRKK